MNTTITPTTKAVAPRNIISIITANDTDTTDNANTASSTSLTYKPTTYAQFERMARVFHLLRQFVESAERTIADIPTNYNRFGLIDDETHMLSEYQNRKLFAVCTINADTTMTNIIGEDYMNTRLTNDEINERIARAYDNWIHDLQERGWAGDKTNVSQPMFAFE